ncbi:hypothetical protein ASA1KI_13010 [Opitutales bacterium ASA1]|uniref:hypothetical protein n=1 Tax=Congregicoccus parvus TaxID=3081749 RepID=UPI002B2843EA|nr:hypothetical protein ASA1KI_13010 [Opitutales bacterium ASA1]
MKSNNLKHAVRGMGLLLAGVCTAVSLEAAAGGVVSAGRRLDTLKTAEQAIQRVPTDWKQIVADVADPFFPAQAPVETIATDTGEVVTAQKPAKSSEEILSAVAPRIAPTGTMLIGAEPYLLIGGRRYGSGDQISVTFEDTVYAVTITSIERNSYTLRLEDKELRREFK